jgi:outer membrane protein assembly factor BamB
MLYFNASKRVLALMLLLAAMPVRAADWPTYRGNAARTGCVDGQAGPAAGKVLWAHTAKYNYIASPAIGDGVLLLPGLGPFNVSDLFALSLDPAAAKRVAWSKGPPVITLPLGASPTVSGGLILFGDGLHHTDNAYFRAFDQSGTPLWQLFVPGELVHIEGGAAVAGGRAYFGAGSGGVYCVDPQTVIVGGKEMPLASAGDAIKAAWADPAADKPAPKVMWNAGKGQWHVDAPINIDGDRLLVCSSFLDKEKQGRRALLCLKPSDGSVVWEAPLTFNPWGGAAIAGDKAIMGTSPVGMYRNLLAGAKGEILAIHLSDGSIAWKKPVKGGVIGPVAVKDGLAVFTATDGKVRAYDAATGGLKWTCDAGSTFFAGPALAGDKAYVADIAGLVSAVNLADGTIAWSLDLTADATVKLPKGAGVYGSPVVHGGRLYLATYNEAGGSQMAVVCIAEK